MNTYGISIKHTDYAFHSLEELSRSLDFAQIDTHHAIPLVKFNQNYKEPPRRPRDLLLDDEDIEEESIISLPPEFDVRHIPVQELPPGCDQLDSMFEVLPGEIYNPARFYTNLRGDNYSLKLDELMAKMQRYYGKVDSATDGTKKMAIPAHKIVSGQYCVAPFEGEWNRAVISSKADVDSVNVSCLEIPKLENRFKIYVLIFADSFHRLRHKCKDEDGQTPFFAPQLRQASSAGAAVPTGRH